MNKQELETNKAALELLISESGDKCIDYDGKVHCESLELSDHYNLTEMIIKKVHALFVETEELDTTEDDNHPVEKLQN